MNDRHQIPEHILRATDAVFDEPLMRIKHAWRRLHGTDFTYRSELLEWLVAEKGMTLVDAENLTMDAVAELLKAEVEKRASREAEASIIVDLPNETDREILEATPFDEWLTASKIEKHTPHSHDTVRQHLRESQPLRTMGYITKNPSGSGYRRVK